jgi:alpha-1,6-mannosyltransferase
MLTEIRIPPRRFPAQGWLAAAGGLLLEPAYLYLHRLGNLELYVVAFIATGFAAGVLYFIFLYLFEHSRDSRAGLWLILATAVLFRLTLWPLAPTLSEDLYRYRWDGRVQLAGWNPYAISPNDPRLNDLREAAVRHFAAPELPAIYPPLAELTFREAARYLPTPRLFKSVPAGADLLTLFLLAAWLRRIGARNYQLAIYAWNPLVIVEFAGSGHSDALALALLVGALVIIRSRPRESTLLLAGAALLKSFPVMLIPLWLRWHGWPQRARAWLEGVFAAAFAAWCAWPYRSALRQIPVTMTYFESHWQNNNASLYALLRAASGSHEIAAGIGVGVTVGLACWTAMRKMEPARAAYIVVGAILMFTPNAYSWYFTWMVPLLCLFPNPAWLLLTVLQFISYHVLIDYQVFGRFQFQPAYVFLTYAPFYAWLLFDCIRGKPRQNAAPQAA